MQAPSRPDSPAPLSCTVHTGHGPEVLSQKVMVARAEAGAATGAAGPSILRVVPLLRVFGPKGRRVVLVGHTRLVVQDFDHVAVESMVSNVWAEGPAEGEFTRLDIDEDTVPADGEAVTKALTQFESELPGWPEATGAMDLQMFIAQYAKNLAEASRNFVAQVREGRYDLEHRLATFSAKGHSTASNTPIVASLLELNIICGRAADEAREAVREGLWLHLSDSKAYHAYRRLQDPSIINDAEPATPGTRPWMRLHDAAVRQCLEMRKQLDAESDSARALMAAAASISNSREADAQSAFNTLAAGLLAPSS